MMTKPKTAADYTTDQSIFEVRRKRREAQVHEGVVKLFLRLRSLSGSGSPIEQARALRDRYARALCGGRPGIGGDVFAEFLLSAEAADDAEEGIDERFMALESAQIDAATHGAGAVRQAMLRGTPAAPPPR